MARKIPLAPWDVNTHFRTPTETVFSPPAGITQVAPSNPMRVGLIIASQGGAGNTILTTDPRAVALQGIPLTNSSPVLYLTHAEWGPLVAVAWFVNSSGGIITVTVVEIMLADWPTER